MWEAALAIVIAGTTVAHPVGLVVFASVLGGTVVIGYTGIVVGAIIRTYKD